ncbi:MAG: hypothetical protein ACI8P3_002952 [Saprospiraceae bacterium]
MVNIVLQGSLTPELSFFYGNLTISFFCHEGTKAQRNRLYSVLQLRSLQALGIRS